MKKENGQPKEKQPSVINKPKPPSRLKNLSHFWLALVVGLAFTLVAFEYRIDKDYIIIDLPVPFEDPEMPELIPITVQKPEKVELPEPSSKPKATPSKFLDFKVVDDYQQKFIEDLGASKDFDPSAVPDLFGDEGDEGDVDIVGDPFAATIEAESMLPLFCDCADLPTKWEQEACNNEKIQLFLRQNLRFPVREREQGKSGTATVNYVVDRNGIISEVKVENQTEPGFAREAIRVVKQLPCMKPAKQYNQNVAVRYRIPIKFKLRN